jgi:hypothetical protein
VIWFVMAETVAAPSAEMGPEGLPDMQFPCDHDTLQRTKNVVYSSPKTIVVKLVVVGIICVIAVVVPHKTQ